MGPLGTSLPGGLGTSDAIVVGYASYSYCNEISQVQLYLKMLRLKHSAVLLFTVRIIVLVVEFAYDRNNNHNKR